MIITRLAFSLVVGAVTVGCKSTHSERVAGFQELYRSGDFAAAERAADQLIREETGLDDSVLSAPRTLAGAGEVSGGDAFLFVLEKAMARLALGDSSGALVLLRRARDEMDARAHATAVDYLESTILDDTYRAYRAFDHEILMVRSMIALCDLVEGSNDSFPLALEIGAKQREMIDAGFGAEADWNYRLLYPRISFGSYLAGILLETKQRSSEAAKAFRDASEEGSDAKLIRAAIDRSRVGRYTTAPGDGVVHVFFLLGGSPTLVETVHPPTDTARLLAGAAITLVADSASAAMQVPIRVPRVLIHDEYVVPVEIQSKGKSLGFSEPLVDLNGIMSEELDAMMEWILARAMVRRSVKAAASATLEHVIRKNVGSDYGDEVAFLAGATLNMGATAVEDADTRSWTALPAQIHAARIELPAGRHRLAFGPMTQAEFQVAAGHDTFVIVVMPDPALPATAIVDRASR